MKRLYKLLELPIQDARRPCQMVLSDLQEMRPPAMKDSAVVLPESHKAMS
jgi:hypothetical protein